MKNVITNFLCIVLLSSCAGVTVYQDAVTVTKTSVDRNGHKHTSQHVVTPPLVKFHADVMGDIKVKDILAITTPVDGHGNIPYTETPVTISGTTVITRQPMTAQIKSASVVDAYFSGATKVIGATGRGYSSQHSRSNDWALIT